MKITKIAFAWWEPFPAISWILDWFNWSGTNSVKHNNTDSKESNCKDGAIGKQRYQTENQILPRAEFYKRQRNAPSSSEQVIGTPSGGDYSKGEQEDIVPVTSSMFATTFNTTTINLLFGESFGEEPSLDPRIGSAFNEKDADSTAASEESDEASDWKDFNDWQLVLNTLRSIIERVQVSASKSRISVLCSESLERVTETPLNEHWSKRLIYSDQPDSPSRAEIKLDCSYNTVKYVVGELGLKESKGSNWDLLWTSRPIRKSVYAKFTSHQRANRFPESETVIGKNNLAAYLNRMSRKFPREYDFWPKSWILPKEWLMLEAFAQAHPEEWIIVKPHKGCGGQGIYLTQDTSRLRKCKRMQSQVYIQRPFLIDNLKFDLRIYVLMTSCNPLRVFVYNEGLARFATKEYEEPNYQNKNDMYMHLTNYSLNKNSPTYNVGEKTGTLRRFSTIYKWLLEHNFDAGKVIFSIDDIVMKTTLAMLPTLKYNYYSTLPDHFESLSCFQIFGFDIIFDRNLKAYLLEVNSTPSLQADVPLDIEMTNSLIFDTFDMLNLCKKSNSSMKRRIEWEDAHMGNFRRVYPSDNTKHYSRFMAEAEKFVLKNSRTTSSVKASRSARSRRL